MKALRLNSLPWLAFICSVSFVNSGRANVYATDIRLNASHYGAVIVPGQTLTITYILNEPASAGVTIAVISGTNTVQTLSSTNANVGTNTGLNSVLWTCPGPSGTNWLAGVYHLSITAASTGYTNWTNITDDSSNFFVTVPRGICVNRNNGSPFYGRVYIANTYTRFGISKCNADGSPGDEGGFSSGGLSWGAGTEYPKYSPWKIAVSSNDQVYIDDFSGDGVLYKFGPAIPTNGYSVAIGPDNYPIDDPDPQLSGVALLYTNGQTWITMSDAEPGSSAGIIAWQTSSQGIAFSNDPGTVLASLSTNALTQAPYDLDCASNGCIYTIQYLTDENSPAPILLGFSPFTGVPETNVNFAVGQGDTNLLAAYGVAIDATGTNLAVAVVGATDPEMDPSGGLYLFCATNGQLMTNLDQTGGDPYYDVAWDQVGNLYALDGLAEVWRVYSPPGTNQATTAAAPYLQIYPSINPPLLLNPFLTMNWLHFTLNGQSNVTYCIQSSVSLTNWNTVLTNFSTNATRPISVPGDGAAAFYRAVAIP